MMADLELDNSHSRPYSHSRVMASYEELLDANYLPRRSSFSQPRPLLAIRTSATRTGLSVASRHGYHAPEQTSLRLDHSSPSLPSSPVQSIDAPGLRDDNLLNLMDWGANNFIAIGLRQDVFLYNPLDEFIQTIHVCTNPKDYVTSVKWADSTETNSQLAIATFLSELQVWDVETMTLTRSLRSHKARIGSLSWRGVLASGSRHAIHLSDVRCVRHLVAKFVHPGEVCGLAWSPDGDMLASGSTKNSLCLWDHTMLRSRCPRSKHEHCAPVQALTWSPWQRRVLASGGGTQDGTIKLWQAATGKMVRSVSTGPNVCALAWSSTTRHLLSAHGDGSGQHEVALWTFKTLNKVHAFTGQSARVLSLAVSPDGSTVVSAAADETLRFWDAFMSKESNSRWPKKVLDTCCIR